MSTTLCLDLGNTRLKWAFFNNEEIRHSGVLREDGVEDLRNCIEIYKPDKSILSSVVDHSSRLEDILEANTHFHKLDHHSRVPITTPVGKPETIGADRLALVVGASHYYPENNNLVIGLGSAVTYNYITRFHQFIGGSISPGMEMRFKALELFTSKLPLVQPHWKFGMAKEIDGMIEAYEDRYENLHTVMTGGDAHYFMPYLKRKITEDPDLLFKGLYTISEYNFSN